MPNALDSFIEKGNVRSLPIIGDVFTWNAVDYTGTVSDLVQDEFFNDEAQGSRKNAERMLEAALSQFPTGTKPAIHDSITFDSQTYKIVSIESLDTTNVTYKIRIPLTEL